ncbi:MAG: hypothetical protein KAS58_04775, partial [Calditrichia bacterium]|nr:hypothetical protein [Calditrichia bacterium]
VAIPARINIYENSDGKTYVNYFKISKQLAEYENEEIQKIAKMLDEKLAKLTGMLSNSNNCSGAAGQRSRPFPVYDMSNFIQK